MDTPDRTGEIKAMNTQERIEELQEMKLEYILNESAYADDSPSWSEVAEASAIAESKWDETDEGKELKALLNDEIDYDDWLFDDESDDDYGYAEQKNFD